MTLPLPFPSTGLFPGVGVFPGEEFWPAVDFAVCWAAGRTASPLQSLWCSLTERTEGKVTSKRGKTFELDQVQPAELTVQIRNDDGAFDASNASSPYAGYVQPYRLFRLRAQYPATVNLLTADQATAGSTSGIFTVPQVTVGPSGNLTFAIGGSPQAYRIGAAGSVASGQTLMTIAGFSIAPGLGHAAQAQVWQPTGAAVGVALRVDWYNAAGAVISTVNGSTVTLTGTAQTVSVGGTAPSAAAGAVLSLVVESAFDATKSVAANQLQVEKGAAVPSVWTLPGTWYPIATGYVERWPQSWTSGGSYSSVDLTVVDLFGFLSQVDARWPFEADLLALNPNFLYRLDESSGATQFADATGNRPNMTIGVAAAPWMSSGNNLTSQDSSPLGADGTELTGAYLGGSAAVVTTTQAGPRAITGVTSGTPRGTQLLIPGDPATGNVGPPVSGAWTRLIAVRAQVGVSASITTLGPLWYCADPGGIGGFEFFMLASTGVLAALLANSVTSAIESFTRLSDAGSQADTTPPYTIREGDWHLICIGYDPSIKRFRCGADGTLNADLPTFPYNLTPTPTTRANGAWIDALGGNFYNAQAAWAGDFSYACELPFLISAAQFEALYQSWRNAWSYSTANAGERSDVRYARILSWLGLGAYPQRLSAGASVEYGPATDVQGQPSPSQALGLLQNVVDTECGQHFIAGDGTIVFQARSDRYNPAAPSVVFGENLVAGEIPYRGEGLVVDNDPTRIANDVTVSLQYGQSSARAQDAVSQAEYGTVSLSRTVNTVDPYELAACPQYLLYQNRQPLPRIEQLPIDVAAFPTAWPVLLGLELGSVVQINRRPSNAPPFSITAFVEQIQWEMDDRGGAVCTLQLSNAAMHYFAALDDAAYGLLDSTAVLGF